MSYFLNNTRAMDMFLRSGRGAPGQEDPRVLERLAAKTKRGTDEMMLLENTTHGDTGVQTSPIGLVGPGHVFGSSMLSR